MDLRVDSAAWSRKDSILLGILLVFFCVWTVLFMRNPFFWDAVLYSQIAQWYIDADFARVVVPEYMDPGHPPFFGLYLAGLWKTFGKSLPVAHFGMLPFLLGLSYFYYKLVKYFVPDKALLLSVLLLFAECTFVAQATMPSHDMIMVMCWLGALYFILSGKGVWQALLMLLLAFVNVRGVVGVCLIFLTEQILIPRREPVNYRMKTVVKYLPAGIITLAWMFWHQRVAGWNFVPPDETYGTQRDVVSALGVLRNVALVVWRCLDFGRVFLWGFLGVVSLFYLFRKRKLEEKTRQILAMMIVPLIGYTIFFAPFFNQVGHRYFLIVYVLAVIWASMELGKITSGGKRWVVFIIVAIGMASGHFWIYPRDISKGWDSSLAHVPYFDLRTKMVDHILEQGIDPGEVVTDFPNIKGRKYTDLKDEDWVFRSKEFYRIEESKYIFYSNIFNGFSNQEMEILEEEFTLEQEFKSRRICVRLYKKL